VTESGNDFSFSSEMPCTFRSLSQACSASRSVISDARRITLPFGVFTQINKSSFEGLSLGFSVVFSISDIVNAPACHHMAQSKFLEKANLLHIVHPGMKAKIMNAKNSIFDIKLAKSEWPWKALLSLSKLILRSKRSNKY
jgi:hypothetical protein